MFDHCQRMVCILKFKKRFVVSREYITYIVLKQFLYIISFYKLPGIVLYLQLNLRRKIHKHKFLLFYYNKLRVVNESIISNVQ